MPLTLNNKNGFPGLNWCRTIQKNCFFCVFFSHKNEPSPWPPENLLLATNSDSAKLEAHQTKSIRRSKPCSKATKPFLVEAHNKPMKRSFLMFSYVFYLFFEFTTWVLRFVEPAVIDSLYDDRLLYPPIIQNLN